MPRALWQLIGGRPAVEIVLTLAQGAQPLRRRLLADTGAGSAHAGFELLLDENDCLLGGGTPVRAIALGGAYAGSFPTYAIRVQIPALGFDHHILAVGLPSTPTGLDGIAGIRFLNRFTYGNFADSRQFGLET